MCNREMLVVLVTHQYVGYSKKLLQMTNVKVAVSAKKLKEEIEQLTLACICHC